MTLVVQNARKFSIALALYCQSEASLVEAYGKSDATAIIGNCWTRMYFTAADLNTSRNLEETLGRTEEEDERGVKRVVPLMTRENVRLLSECRAIVLCGNREPVLARLTPYYRRRRLRLRSEIPPVQMEADPETFKKVKISEPHVEPEAQQAAPVSGE
jgi:type IV secretory pathway TraG/TraD family ATPase VirD4